MNRILLIYAASGITAKSIPIWKSSNSTLGYFFDLQVLGEPMEIFEACDRPYVKFIHKQIKKRMSAFGITSVIVLSSKFSTKKSVKCLNFVPHKLNYDLVPVSQKLRPEYSYKQMILKY